VSVESPEHHLLAPAAAVGNSHILAYLDTSKIATGLWSEEIKINKMFLNVQLPAENKSQSECPRPD
jgi:hypothetical protein